MKRSAMGLAAALVAVLAMCGASTAEMTPEQAKAAAECVGKFSAREFSVRQKAVQKLVRLGPEVVPLIKKTLAASRDNEVKLRCEMVLRGIRNNYIVGLNDERINVGASLHSLDVRDVPVGPLLKGLTSAAGNAPIVLKGTGLEKRPVTVSFEDVPYWEAVDRLAVAAKVGYAYDYTTSRFVLQSTQPAVNVSVYSGPVVVKPYVVTRTIAAINGSDRRGMSFSFLCMWEERLPVIFGGLVVTKATGRDGTDVAVRPAGTRRPLWVGPSVRYTVSAVDPGRVGIDSVDLDGFVRLEYAVGRKEGVVRDVFAPAPDSLTIGEFTLKVVEAGRVGGEVRLTVEGKTKGARPSLHTAHADYGLFLRDAQRKLYPGKLLTQPYVVGGYRMMLSFGAAKAPQPLSLVLVYPERTETRDYPFTLKTVPLP